MNYNQNCDRNINFKNWIIEVVSCWRILLVCLCLGVVLGTVFCVYKWYNPGTEVVVEQSELEENGEVEILQELTQSEVNAVTTLREIEQNYLKQLDYVKNAPVMKLKAEELPVVELQFFIETKDNEESEKAEKDRFEIKSYYSKCLESQEFYQAVLDNVEGVQNDVYFTEYLDGTKGFWRKSSSDASLIIYSVCGKDLETAEKIADIAVQHLLASKSEAIQLLGEHDIKLINYNAKVCYSIDLLNYQKDKINATLGMQSTFQSQKNALNLQQKMYYELLEEGETEEQARERVNAKAIEEGEVVGQIVEKPQTLNVLYIFLGLLGGLIVGILFISIGYIFTDKVYYEDELFTMYGFPKIENIILRNETELRAKKIDWWIYQNLAKKYSLIPSTEAVGLSAIKIAAHFSNKTDCSLGIIVKENDENQWKYAQNLKEELGKRNVCVKIVNATNEGLSEIEKIAGQSVVFVIQHKDENFYELERKIEMCKLFQCEIVGAIVTVK